MHVKVTVFILRVLSGSDPGYRIPPLPECRESTMTMDASSDVNLGATSSTDTTAGDSEPQSFRRHGHANRSTISTPPKRRNSQPPASNPSTTELSQCNAIEALPPQRPLWSGLAFHMRLDRHPVAPGRMPCPAPGGTWPH